MRLLIVALLVSACGRGPAMPPQCNPAVNSTDGHQTNRCEQRR